MLADLDAATKRVKELEAPPPLRFLLNGQGDLQDPVGGRAGRGPPRRDPQAGQR